MASRHHMLHPRINLFKPRSHSKKWIGLNIHTDRTTPIANDDVTYIYFYVFIYVTYVMASCDETCECGLQLFSKLAIHAEYIRHLALFEILKSKSKTVLVLHIIKDIIHKDDRLFWCIDMVIVN